MSLQSSILLGTIWCNGSTVITGTPSTDRLGITKKLDIFCHLLPLPFFEDRGFINFSLSNPHLLFYDTKLNVPHIRHWVTLVAELIYILPHLPLLPPTPHHEALPLHRHLSHLHRKGIPTETAPIPHIEISTIAG